MNFLLKSLYFPVIYTLIENYNTHNEIASRNEWDDEYDFIVIGGGTAGSVVASRLSENPSVTVLVLEAGRNENLINDIPGLYHLSWGSTQDWSYVTAPQVNCFYDTEGQRAVIIHGKVLGGSSSINTNGYIRGHPMDFNNWKNLGCEGWSYDEVLPYFIKSEMNTDEEILNNGFRGNNGPQPILTPSIDDDPIAKHLISAAEELNFRKSDLSGNDTLGVVNIFQMNVLNGMRFSSSKSFLESVFRKRMNLHILTQSFVTKIGFENKSAKSVEFRRNGQKHYVRAKKEIILSAGTIRSPQILMLSGIGPQKHLKNKNITVIVNLAGVGMNLQDHVYVPVNSFNTNATGYGLISENSIEKYLTNLTGPLANVVYIPMIMNSTISHQWPDMILQGSYAPSLSKGKERVKIEYRILLGRPKSKGCIKLKTSDPYDYPFIQPNYLKHPDDVKVLIEAFRWEYRIASTDVFNENNIKISETLVPECEHLYYSVEVLKNGIVIPSNNYLECVIRHKTAPGIHLVGSCKMGSRNYPMAVVSSKLKVHNVSGLRVIDASIMPVIIYANLKGTIVMIAERGAQFIKDEYNLS